jgi:predicted restriction endonuclease
MADRPWTREEVLLTINLYCKLPYQKLRQTTPEIIELADLLKRTPSAISMRCCNYVQFDPVESKRVKGFVRAAKLDRAIWIEINNDWEKFATESERLLDEYRQENQRFLGQEPTTQKRQTTVSQEIEIPIGRAKEQTVRVRIGQRFFREAVLSAYNHQCCITGLRHDALLIASHIKPWKDSDPKTERTNPRNGLCLSPLYDRAFDNGMMAIDEQYRIVFSKIIADCAERITVKHFFKRYEGQKLNLPERFLPEQIFLDYHREHIFQN